MLSLYTSYDAQLELAAFIKAARKRKKYSVKKLSQKTGVADSTIRRFESCGEISLKNFMLLYQALGNLKNIKSLIEIEEMPRSLDDVLRAQRS